METILKYIEKNLNRRKVPIEVFVLEEFFPQKISIEDFPDSSVFGGYYNEIFRLYKEELIKNLGKELDYLEFFKYPRRNKKELTALVGKYDTKDNTFKHAIKEVAIPLRG